MKRYIISEEELNKVIKKITDNLNMKARISGYSLSDVTESVRQAIKYNIQKKSIVVDDDKEEIVVKLCSSTCYNGSSGAPSKGQYYRNNENEY